MTREPHLPADIDQPGGGDHPDTGGDIAPRSGGATLALAEYMAGVGSSILCPDRACVGVNVSGSHVRSAFEGDTVTATAHIVHRGRTLHVWNVTVAGSDGKTISTVSVMNFITDKPTEAAK